MQPAIDPITELRRAIDQLPVNTRTAMLDGIRDSRIIVGAYTDDNGGVCPMLAAHRNGGVTTLLAFARSWDGFTNARQTRRATRREVRVLESQLTQSLLADGETISERGPSTSDLGAAIADHEALKQRQEVCEERPRTDQPAVAEEQIRAARLTPGRIGRLRPRRTAADAERVLARLDEHVLAATR